MSLKNTYILFPLCFVGEMRSIVFIVTDHQNFRSLKSLNKIYWNEIIESKFCKPFLQLKHENQVFTEEKILGMKANVAEISAV